MFAKVFAQILESSLAEDFRVRLVFEDFLKLCDLNGVVDMTPEAISRRTNVPLEIVLAGIEALERPDPRSRTPDAEGRRLVRLDDHREWGWMIVNHAHYRSIASEEQRREKTASRVRVFREKNALKRDVTLGNACNAMQKQKQKQKQKQMQDTETYQTKAPAKAGGIVDGKGSDRLPTSEQAKRVAKIMHRRIDTAWDKKEVDAHVAIGVIPEDDMAILEKYYASNWPPKTSVNHLRQNLVTLLNNFQGEIDRAKHFFTAAKFISKPKPKAST
jgi:hypothetical protein